MRSRGEFQGVGGWLALLILWMVVLRPVAGTLMWKGMHAATTENPLLAGDGAVLVNTSVFWIIILILCALNIYGGLRLCWDRTPASVSNAIRILWVTAPTAWTAEFIHKLYLEGEVSLFEAVGTLALDVAVAAAWIVYLKRSRRVSHTYRNENLA